MSQIQTKQKKERKHEDKNIYGCSDSLEDAGPRIGAYPGKKKG